MSYDLFVNIVHDVWLYNVEILIRLCLFYIYRLYIGGRVLKSAELEPY